jgi:hypothetical protein
MHDPDKDIATLRRFMRDLYREAPGLCGELQMVAITADGPRLIHPDKRAERAFNRQSRAFFQSAEMAKLWCQTIDDCTRLKTSMYSPFFDAIFVNLLPGETNGGFSLDWVLRHELGHALHRVKMEQYKANPQLSEMTADAFATLHALREDPRKVRDVEEAMALRRRWIRRSLRGDFNTAAAIRDALTIAKTNDISAMPLDVMIAVAAHTAEKACPPALVYERDAKGRFLRNPHLAARRRG